MSMSHVSPRRSAPWLSFSPEPKEPMNPLTVAIVLLLQVIRFVFVAAMSLIVTGLTLVIAPFWVVYRIFKPKKWVYDPNRDE